MNPPPGPAPAAASEVLPSPHAGPPGGPRKSPARRAGEIAVSLTLVAVLFGFAIPHIGGATYGEVWDVVATLRAPQIALLLGAWVLSLVAYTGVLSTALPGLSRPQAFVVNLAGSAVSNCVPFGGALGVGTTYGMLLSWGFGVPAITRMIVLSGFWNVFVKLGMPVLALVLLVVTGQTATGLVAAAAIGTVLLAGTVTVFVLIAWSDRLATLVAHVGERIAGVGARLAHRPAPTGWAASAVAFRHDSSDLIQSRWPALTLNMFIYAMGQYLLLLLSLRVLGTGTDAIGWVDAFVAFSFSRLLSAVPFTPSGVGFMEAGLLASLLSFGGDPASVTAAVLLFSTLTYAIEIPAGAVGWLVWATRTSWRKRPPRHVERVGHAATTPAAETPLGGVDHREGSVPPGNAATNASSSAGPSSGGSSAP